MSKASTLDRPKKKVISDKIIAIVTSPIVVEHEALEDIKKMAEEATGKEVEVRTVIDESIMSGMIIEYAGEVFDYSIKTKAKRVDDYLEEITKEKITNKLTTKRKLTTKE